MTNKERFIKTLKCEKIGGQVPHFEMVFFLTMEAFGKVHPVHRNYAQWDQMSYEEQKLHMEDMAQLYIDIAKRYHHSAIFIHMLPNTPDELQKTQWLLQTIREKSGDEYYIMMHGDPTWAIPDGGVIIKFDGYIKVPEEFDLTQTIDKFKPMLITSLVKDTMDQSEQVALQVFLETSDTKIPVLIDFDEQLMCSKLISNNMLVKYEDMEEYEELEVTIIARITSGNMVNAKKAFYDPLKDFMTLNRAMDKV